MQTGSGGTFALAVLIAEWIVRLALTLHIILRRRPVTTSLAWLAVLVFIPIVGLGLYILVGENRLGSRRIRAFDAAARELERTAVSQWRSHYAVATEMEEGGELGRWAHIARYGAAMSGFPPARGNKVSVLNDSSDFLQCLAQDIEDSREHCHILTYIWQPRGESELIAAALIRAARRGVACRVLVDAVGSKKFLRSQLRFDMQTSGVNVVESLPVNPLRMLFARLDLRNHRKIAVIDGRIAYTGSQNITDESFRSSRIRRTGAWIDASLRIEGPAAQGLGIVFLRDWMVDSQERIDNPAAFLPDLTAREQAESIAGSVLQVIPSGPGPQPESIHQALLTTIYSARDELIMTTPYFVPDEATRTALQAAARRGVQVTIVMPQVSDSPLVAAASRAYYLDLLEAGVAIRTYRGGLLHAKTVTVDRKIALVGSANFDQRSFFLNFEISVFVYDDDLASQIRFMQVGYIDKSIEVELEAWRRRPLLHVLRDNSAQLLGPLL